MSLDDPESEVGESSDYSPLGFKLDTFDFVGVCGFNPLTSSFGGF